MTFTWNTNYGNTNSIGLTIDEAAAIAALRKPLENTEHIVEVFASANTLGDILAKIEAKQLPSDSRLGVFAKLWRDRSVETPGGWSVFSWHLWKTYLKPAIPRFLYFDDYRLLGGKINLEALNGRNAANQRTEGDETVLGLFDLAGTDLQELMSEEGYENS